MGVRNVSDQVGLPRLLSLPGFGQEVAPWLSGQVAVVSSGLFPSTTLDKRSQRARTTETVIHEIRDVKMLVCGCIDAGSDGGSDEGSDEGSDGGSDEGSRRGFRRGFRNGTGGLEVYALTASLMASATRATPAHSSRILSRTTRRKGLRQPAARGGPGHVP